MIKLNKQMNQTSETEKNSPLRAVSPENLQSANQSRAATIQLDKKIGTARIKKDLRISNVFSPTSL